ncbi:nucleotidyl transferase AbiEii/AbiGii toxin family protein [Tianweitania sediminis]|uniref:Nucleotidyl transferase AbiEii/AbiGii toxin family protein n=1 Tax=Tianweitania sediminis TaxID=1502156 RepID=A0A8J7UJY2_9HYPH|nr:nucleotidyl transferase AbiEii/AbiGii toxin family protein [Tianweitania sediminis]MBP0439124.1 nucleotidyl transferase AbiEii/AbiGii toxin family protein [Tianweitania sediminis]
MPERYSDDLPEAEKNGWKLSDRTKQIAKGFRLDVPVAFERLTCESLLWALLQVTDLDLMVKGGLLHDQRVRQTGDADLTLERRLSAPALYGAVSAAAAHLRKYGLAVEIGEVHALDMGGKGSGFRVPVTAKIGPTRVVAHLDVGFGPRPEGAVRREFKSLFMGPTFAAWAQPLEHQVADKVAAIITLGAGNTRLKDFADLSRMYRTGLNDTVIARALVSTMRERKADTSILLKECPEGLSPEFAAANRAIWKEYLAQHDEALHMDFEAVAGDAFAWWQDIQDEMLRLAERDELEPQARLEAPAVVPENGKVVDLDAYRRMKA